MRILQIYKDYTPVLGGIENHIRALSEGLAARGHEVTVLVTALTRRGHAEERGGVTVLRAGRLLHAASTPLSPEMLWWARRLRPDVVNLHFPFPPGDVACAALPGGPPLVVTYHSDIVRQRALLRLYRPLLHRTLRHAARIIATSPNYVASSPWLRPHVAKCALVPLSVDAGRFERFDGARAEAFRREAGGRPALLFVGRLRYYKGLHFLLKALAGLDAALLVAGTGPERARLEALAASLGVAGRVRWLGDVSDDDLPALYAAADAYVLPAHLRSEAFGISLLEAQAAGLPIVSTELGTGTSYANQHGVTGLVVPPADPAALARAARVLLANPELRARMGENGRRRARDMFSPERMVALTEQVYGEAVGQRSG
jgi:glycosyltransferase involved in cell wall biosynthesis